MSTDSDDPAHQLCADVTHHSLKWMQESVEVSTHAVDPRKLCCDNRSTGVR